MLGGVGDGKAQGFQAFVKQYLAGMQRAAHRQAEFAEGVAEALDLDAVGAVPDLGQVVIKLQTAPSCRAGAKSLV